MEWKIKYEKKGISYRLTALLRKKKKNKTKQKKKQPETGESSIN